jgi:hypothetical protein
MRKNVCISGFEKAVACTKLRAQDFCGWSLWSGKRFRKMLEKNFVKELELFDGTVIPFHKLLNSKPSRAVNIAHLQGKRSLVVEQQSIFASPGKKVEASPDLPEKVS